MKEDKRNKKIILKPMFKGSKDSTIEFIDRVRDKIDLLYVDPSETFYKSQKPDVRLIFGSENADYVILNNIEEKENFSSKKYYNGHVKEDEPRVNQYLKKRFGVYKKVDGNKDIDEIKAISEKGANFVIIGVDDWKIIPLENIIATLQKTNTEIFAIAKSVQEVETLFTVLELGVDGVIIETDDEQDILKIKNIIREVVFNIEPAKILEIKDIGTGERVCIDTVSMLSEGEGMLIGNKSNFLFLVHNESIGSSFTSPRPFRVNAGAVHCYTVVPNGSTKYLSELESGSQILIVNPKGLSRTVSVGRAKIETRPLRLFKAICKNETGSIIVQNAETIRFMDKNEEILPVTHVKTGDEVLVFTKGSSGRHFGMEVSDEYILEK